MYFGLSEDQLMLQDSVGRYLEGASELEEVRKFVDGDGALAETLHKGLDELGVPFVLLPEAQGGLGMGVLEAALISETLGRHVSRPRPSPPLMAWRLSACAKRVMKIGCRKLRQAGRAWVSASPKQLAGAMMPVSPLQAIRFRAAPVLLWGQMARRIFCSQPVTSLVVVERGAKGVSETELTTIDRTRTVLTLDLDNVAASVVAGNNHAEAQRKMIDAGRVFCWPLTRWVRRR